MDRRLRALVNLALVVGIGVAIWMADLVLGRVRAITTDVVLAVLVAYLIFPAVRPLATRMPRALAVAIVYLVLFAVLAGGVAALSPALAAQGAEFAHEFPVTVARAQRGVEHPASVLPLVGPVEPALRHALARYADRVGALTGSAAAIAGTHAAGVFRGTVRAVVDAAVVLLLAFFFIIDVERIRAFFLRMVPRERREAVDRFVDDCDTVIGGFVRGQVLLAVIVGVAATVILLATGVKYAVLLGIVTGICSIVPLVGPIVGAAPAILVALFSGGLAKALIVLVLFVVVFELQGHVLTPVIIGKALGVSPLVIFLAILIGVEADGVLGMLLAVPIAGIARVTVDRLFPDDATDRALVAKARSETAASG